MSSIITLTTDFGLNDEYVGVMKGVILCQAPDARIIDLCHGVPAQDIRSAAYLLQASFAFFPPQTIHTIVVDPGVGSNRDIILVLHKDHLFLAPDNGLLTPILDHSSLAFRLENKQIPLQHLSTTFHGRDIFAPCAAFLANNGNPEDFGPQIPISSLQTIPLPQPVIDSAAGIITGTVISIDRFGNIGTNISVQHLESITARTNNRSIELVVGNHRIKGLNQSYKETAVGQPLLIVNSRNHLEVAISQGSAAQTLEIKLNDPLKLEIW